MKAVAVSGAATVLAAVFTLGIGTGMAGASTLQSGDQYTTLNTACTGCPAVTSGAPYSGGQTITVQEAATGPGGANPIGNSLLSPPAAGGSYYLDMCTDPGGTPGNLPTSISNCETRTQVSIAKTSTGAFSKTMKVYDLPYPALGVPTMTGVCDTDPNFCVIGIFTVNPGTNQSTFLSQPHLFSAPFQVQNLDGLNDGANPGDGTPEVPLAIGLPLAALAIVGGFTVRNRRRREQAA